MEHGAAVVMRKQLFVTIDQSWTRVSWRSAKSLAILTHKKAKHGGSRGRPCSAAKTGSGYDRERPPRLDHERGRFSWCSSVTSADAATLLDVLGGEVERIRRAVAAHDAVGRVVETEDMP